MAAHLDRNTQYQLSHSYMAYQIFSTVLKRVHIEGHQNIYICDVGSGINAGLVGLLLSLKYLDIQNKIYFDRVEPSKEMIRAGKYFYEYLPDKLKLLSKQLHRSENAFRSFDPPHDTMRIVTAFHLSAPYSLPAPKKCHPRKNSSIDDLNHAITEIAPHLILLTCHEGKNKIFNDVIKQDKISNDYSFGQCSVPQPADLSGSHLGTPTKACFLWRANKSLHY